MVCYGEPHLGGGGVRGGLGVGQREVEGVLKDLLARVDVVDLALGQVPLEEPVYRDPCTDRQVLDH